MSVQTSIDRRAGLLDRRLSKKKSLFCFHRSIGRFDCHFWNQYISIAEGKLFCCFAYFYRCVFWSNFGSTLSSRHRPFVTLWKVFLNEIEINCWFWKKTFCRNTFPLDGNVRSILRADGSIDRSIGKHVTHARVSKFKNAFWTQTRGHGNPKS